MIDKQENSFWDSIPDDDRLIKISHVPVENGNYFYYACSCGQTHWHYKLGDVKCVSCANEITLVNLGLEEGSFRWDYVSIQKEKMMGGKICFRKSHTPKDAFVSLYKPDNEGGFLPVVCKKHSEVVVNLWEIKKSKAICAFCDVKVSLHDIGVTHYMIINKKK